MFHEHTSVPGRRWLSLQVTYESNPRVESDLGSHLLAYVLYDPC